MVQAPIKPSASSERQEVIDWLIAHNYPALPVAPAQSAWKYYKLVKTNSEEGVWSYCPLTVDLQPIPLYTGKNPSYLDSDGVPHLVNHRQYQNRLPSQKELEVWFANLSNGIGTLGGWNNTIWLDFDVKQFPSQQECDAAVLKILERLERCSLSSSGSASELVESVACPKGIENVLTIQQSNNPTPQTFIERSHSGGWRIGIKVKQKPDFTNFSLTPGGPHVGEALFEGRFTVLAPTIGKSGNPYRSINRTLPMEVESLESIGIYSTSEKKCEVGRMLAKRGVSSSMPEALAQDEKTLHTSTCTLQPSVGSIPLEMLGNGTSRNILRGDCPTGDRSKALATATQEWYGWQNWTHNNGIHIIGDAATLAHHAGSLLGLDFDRINRILKTIDPRKCHPAALYRGGETSCWQKIHRLDKATFEAKCPAHIKDAIAETFRRDVSTGQGSGNGGGSGGGRRGGGGIGSGGGGDGSDGDNRERGSRVVKLPSKESLDTAAIRRQIKDILIQDLPPSELQTAKIRIRTDNPGVSEREISRLFETIEQELELEESRSDRRSEVDNLLKLGDQSLNISKFLPSDLAEPLKDLAKGLNIRPEVCLTSLLVATSSLHKTKTELVIHRSQGFSVPPTIFAGLVSESGQKKSPILKAIIKKPMNVLQREKREAFQEALVRYEKEISDWDKCKSEERSSKFPEGKPKLPQQRLYYFTNATGEGLLYQFQAHPDKALLALVDELVGLFASQNKYSGGRGSDRQDILSAFDGTGATVLRATGTKADIDGLLLSICGTIQPEVLKRLMRDCSDPDGQWARFLFVNQPLAAATLADDDGSGVDLTGRLLSYYRAIDQLPAREYRLSRSSFKHYQPVYNQLEQLRVSHPNPGMRAVYSKMEGYIGRLALNLHVLHELSSGKTLPDEEIPLSILKRAIALAKFYIGQVKLIHANFAADLGEMAPHLAKVVELSKRMDATTGNSWIKAKVVQSGYDSRHRPRPDAIRSWFRELEALGIGSTRGAGIRLEYSWKLPDLPFDESDPLPQQKVEKVDKSGEKWITSPPTETTQNQGNPPKVEKVDNPTHLNDLELPNLDLGLRDAEKKLSPPDEQHWGLETSDLGLGIGQKAGGDSLEITHSTYPLSGCDDGIASTQAVETISTFSPPVESVSTFQDYSEPDGTISIDEATLFDTSGESLKNIQSGISLRVFPLNQHQELIDSNSLDAQKEVRWKVVLSTTALQKNLDISTEYCQAQVTVEEFTSHQELKSCTGSSAAVASLGGERRIACRVSALVPTSVGSPGSFCTNASPLLALLTAVGIQGHGSFLVEWSSDSPNPPEAAELPTTETCAEVDRLKVGDHVIWDNCPSHCEQFAPFEITAIDGDYAHLDLFSKPVLLAELHPIRSN